MLSPTEMRLYRALERATTDLDGWALVDLVWPCDCNADLMRLCNYIHRLRRKLRGRATIEYRRGAGYRLVRGQTAFTPWKGAHLSQAQAQAIRASSEPVCACARRFGVSHATVSKIRHGRLWAHVA